MNATEFIIEFNDWVSGMTNSELVDKLTHMRHTKLSIQKHIDFLLALEEAFPGHQALLVGGCVRDIILGINPKDFDVATNIPIDALKETFGAIDITKNTDNPQPVVTINYGGYSYEVAAFRADSKTEGRSNNVSTIVTDFRDDAARRDITINALGMDARSVVYDYVDGQADLSAKLIRCVGDPSERFGEDATRILRVLRFAAKYDFKIHPDTGAAIRSQSYRLNNRSEISPESIGKELYKSAESGVQLRRFIELLKEYDLLQMILPEVEALYGLTHNPKYHPEGGSTVIGHVFECLNCAGSNDMTFLLVGNSEATTVNSCNLAVLFHDLGKGVTAEVGEDGHMTYNGHEGAGVPIVEKIFERFRFNDLTASDKEAILFATKKHMLIHNLPELSIKTKVSLVHSPHWNTLVYTSYCDEASRGEPLFNEDAFYKKISDTCDRVASIAPSSMELRRQMKAYIDGYTLLDWIPELKDNRKMMSPIIEHVCDSVLAILDSGREPTQAEVKEIAVQRFDSLNLIVKAVDVLTHQPV